MGRRLAAAAFGTLLSVVGATLTALVAARVTSVLFVTIATGVTVLAAGTAISASTATAGLGLSRPRRAWITAGAMVAVTALVGWAVLPPLRDDADPPATVRGMSRVTLETGSELAYLRLSAAGASRGEIVWIHGGPGTPDMQHDAEFLQPLTSEGFDVVVYDQVGAGHSARLQDPSLYSLPRDVADLQALLDHLGADRPILIGHSYGATVLAALLAKDPTRARHVVFLAPGAIRPAPAAVGTGMMNRLTPAQRERLYALLLEPRALWRWLLTQANAQVARGLAGDAEMDARFDRIYAATAPGLYCAAPDPIPLPRGLGFYTNAAARDVPDLRPGLAAVTVPALIVKPECDYLPWSFGTDLAETLPQASLVYVEKAGHALHQEQPGIVRDTILQFLEDGVLPVPSPATLEPPSSGHRPREDS